MSTTAESLPKKIKLIRDKYPNISGAEFRLTFKKYTYSQWGTSTENIDYHDLKKETKEDNRISRGRSRDYDNAPKNCPPIMCPSPDYSPFYISDKGTEISVKESTDTHWFKPIEEPPVVMTLREVQNKLGIKNLIIKYL